MAHIFAPFTLNRVMGTRILDARTALGAVVPLKLGLPVLTVAAIVWLARELMRPAANGQGPAAPGTTAAIVNPARLLAAFLMAAAFGGVGIAACMSGNLAVVMFPSCRNCWFCTWC
jgi:hypothetical protein